MTADITGIFDEHPERCPHTYPQIGLFDNELTCAACGEPIETDEEDLVTTSQKES